MKSLLSLPLLVLLSPFASAERPNILIILADDLGYSDLACMGGDAETPHLDALAENGILFPNFYNDAKCAPSRASLMTGMSNHRTGAHHGAGDVTHCAMTLAEALQVTHTNLMIDKWHIKPKPLELGFDRYFGSPLSAVYWWPEDAKTRDKLRLDDRQYTQADMVVPVEQWYLTVEDTKYAGRTLHPLDGQSLLPHIKTNRVTERTLCWNYEKLSAIRMGRWKGVRRSVDRHAMEGDWQLYDLAEGRSEMEDVSESHPEVVETMLRIWDDWRQDVGSLHKGENHASGKDERSRRQRQ